MNPTTTAAAAPPGPRSAKALGVTALVLVLFASSCLPAGVLVAFQARADSALFGSLVVSPLATLGGLACAGLALARSRREGGAGRALAFVSIGLAVVPLLMFCVVGAVAWLLGQHIKF